MQRQIKIENYRISVKRASVMKAGLIYSEAWSMGLSVVDREDMERV